MTYVLIASGLLIIFLLYRHLAKIYQIVDKPNVRSSHSHTTIRGGGIIFPLAAFLWFFVSGFDCILGVTGLFLIASISFLDDLHDLHRDFRLSIQIVAVSLLFVELSFFETPWYFWIVAYVLMTGWLNAFNFMDGINGITSFYSLTTLGTFLMVSEEIRFVDRELLLILIISVAIFSLFNVRKRALAFAGDVGSVSMAFLLGGIMLSLILNTEIFEYILFFAVYAADSVFTIAHRLIRRENIFEAHRTHLYQYLSNEMGLSHIAVSLIYAGIQFIINVVVIFLIYRGIMNFGLFVLATLFISFIYLSARFYVIKSAKNRVAR
ncbi:MAG: UDP-GlcNAc--UDP-phosphate GlcNAc-1-phosphate transferase [bacterium]